MMTERDMAALEGFQASYVEVAGLPTWHEVRGGGPAIVLLHGGFSGAAAWSAQAAVLPGTHALPLELPGVVNALLVAFLRGTISASVAAQRSLSNA